MWPWASTEPSSCVAQKKGSLQVKATNAETCLAEMVAMRKATS